ncbi:hypothetical protein D9M72_502630 [compost metagenome]
MRCLRQADSVIGNSNCQELVSVITLRAVGQQPDSSGPSLQAMFDGVRHQLVDHQGKRGGEIAGELTEQPGSCCLDLLRG